MHEILRMFCKPTAEVIYNLTEIGEKLLTYLQTTHAQQLSMTMV